MEQKPLPQMTPWEKTQYLFREQKKTLDLFLQNGAITQAQYEKSLGDLRAKMGIQEQEMGE